MTTKQALRRQLRRSREAMTDVEVAEKSAVIVVGVQAILEKLSVKGLHCYEPIASLHEVDISLLEAEATYTSRNIDGKWEVVSFLTGKIIPQPAIDVIIVPMLGFDTKLQRIGYGGGYYDRLLAQYPQALKIGVCYESGRLDYIPAEPHDIPMNIIVTDVTATIAV